MDIPNTLDNVQSARSVLSTFPFIDGKMTLRYLTYNVSGLLSKLDNAAFVNYITSFDFVCLTETFIASDFDSDLFRDFGIFVAKAKKLSSHGRLSVCYGSACWYLLGNSFYRSWSECTWMWTV